MYRAFFRSNVLLISLGVGLGLAARSVLGPPDSKTPFPRAFSEPLPPELAQQLDSERKSVVGPDTEPLSPANVD